MQQAQIDYFVKFFRDNEKNPDQHKIGAEFEFFIIRNDNLQTVSYYGKNGIESILYELSHKFGWNKDYQDKHLIGLHSKCAKITLEPGAQFEISFQPHKLVPNMIGKYIQTVIEIITVLENKNYSLIASGYQPYSKISEIEMIPKKRYELMYDYFAKCGCFAHNMMMGTASIQVTVDYSSEKDFRDKMQLAYKISPLIALFFDNSPLFERKKYKHNCLRQKIWANCDDDRCGFVPNVLSNSFGYADYAKYILNSPPIFLLDNKGNIIPYEKPLKNIFDPENITKEQFLHTLSMQFPHVRARQYIEFRVADSVPYPLNFSLLALLKIIFYDKNIRDFLLDLCKDISENEVKRCMQEIEKRGFDFSYAGYDSKELLKIIFYKIKQNNNCCANSILIPLYDIIQKRKSMKMELAEINDIRQIIHQQNMYFIKRCAECVNI